MFECLECWGFGGPRGQRARQRKGSPTTSCCRPLGASSRAASRSSWDGSGRSMVPSGRAKSPSYPRSAAWIRDGLRSRRESQTEPHLLRGHPSGRPSPVAAVERGVNPISDRSGVGTRPTCRATRFAPSSRALGAWRILRHDAPTRSFSTGSDVGQRPGTARRASPRRRSHPSLEGSRDTARDEDSLDAIACSMRAMRAPPRVAANVFAQREADEREACRVPSMMARESREPSNTDRRSLVARYVLER